MPARKSDKQPKKNPKPAARSRKAGKSSTSVRSHAGHDHGSFPHDHAHDAQDAGSRSIGRRNTRPRNVIIAILAQAVGPLTVPEIHAQAQGVEPGETVGIATVYRTLNLLVENKLAQAVVMPSGETRYEAAGHKGHHDHFQCVDCARVFDIDTCLLGLPAGVVIPGGYRVQGHELTLRGLCPDCDASPRDARRSKPRTP
jgi:Fur family ferric uptake transcriptional regulator